jgi:hypothetical protein
MIKRQTGALEWWNGGVEGVEMVPQIQPSTFNVHRPIGRAKTCVLRVPTDALWGRRRIGDQSERFPAKGGKNEVHFAAIPAYSRLFPHKKFIF